MPLQQIAVTPYNNKEENASTMKKDPKDKPSALGKRKEGCKVSNFFFFFKKQELSIKI